MLTGTLELQIRVLNLRGKIVRNVKFSPVSQNSYLSLKLDFTRQNDSTHMFNFPNGILEAYKPILHAKRYKFTLKNVFFNLARSINLRLSLDLRRQNKFGSGLDNRKLKLIS